MSGMAEGQRVWRVVSPEGTEFVTTWPLPYITAPGYSVSPVTVVRVTSSGVTWEHVSVSVRENF